MFRYFCPIILSGGRSSRFGVDKAYFKIKGISLLDFRIYFFFDMGFSFIYIIGYIKKYSYMSDIFLNKGPVFSILKIYLSFFDGYFTHFLFFPVDLILNCKKKIFLMLLNCEIFFSYVCNLYIFPFLLSFSLQTYYTILFFVLNLNFFYLSLIFFFDFIFLEKMCIYNFYSKNFLNINIYYNFFLLD
jgi:hypothetical protein